MDVCEDIIPRKVVVNLSVLLHDKQKDCFKICGRLLSNINIRILLTEEDDYQADNKGQAFCFIEVEVNYYVEKIDI